MPKPHTEEETLKEFGKLAGYVKLNDDEGYYECQGLMALDTRKLFVMWANERRGLNLKE